MTSHTVRSTAGSTGSASAHRRYQRKDDNPMPSSPVVSLVMDADDDLDSIFDQCETGCSSSASSSSYEALVYVSPRTETEDSELFPTRSDQALFQNPRQRWRCISGQAGAHRQDGSVLTLRRNITPLALKGGMVSSAAVRVRSLNLWLDHREDILPKWLDVIATIFPQLEHLSMTQDQIEGGEEIEVSSRMRRLYILYRLPDLRSIDEMPVTLEERKLARPSTPQGERVERKDWVAKQEQSTTTEAEDGDGKSVFGIVEDLIREEEEMSEATVHINTMAPYSRHPLSRAMARQDRVALIEEDDAEEDHSDDRYNPKRTTRLKAIADDDENDELERVVKITVSSSNSGEEREDQSSNSGSGSIREDEDDDHNDDEQKIRLAPAYSLLSRTAEHGRDSIEVGLSSSLPEIIQSGSMSSQESERSASSRSRSHSARKPYQRRDDTAFNDDRKGSLQPTKNTPIVEGVPATPDSIDLVSVATSNYEWTATCGVFSFRGDNSCTPSVQINLCGNSNGKRISRGKEEGVVSDDTFSISGKELLRAKLEKHGAIPHLSHVSKRLGARHRENDISERHSSSSPKNLTDSRRAPLVDKDSSIQAEKISPENAQSPNRKLPPSQSLSSPFPMQFRDRKSPLRISTAEDDLNNTKTETSFVPSSPRARGSVPMDTITEPMTLTVIASSPTKKKTAQTTRRAPAKPGRGGLPPAGPAGDGFRRKVGASSLLQAESMKARKARKLERRKKRFQETARATSVLDTEFEVSSSSEEEDDEEDDIVDIPAGQTELLRLHQGNEW